MLHTMFKSSITALRYSGQITLVRRCSSNIDFFKLISNNKVVVFIKGTADKPRCGYSQRVLQILDAHGIKYDYHNVLENMELREGIKKFSNWPTIPQVYINGEFVGGCDILQHKHKTGDLVKDLNRAGIKSALVKENEQENEK